MSGGSQGAQTGQTQQGFALGGMASPNPPVLSGNLPATTNMGGPDAGVGYAPTNMGFDTSGSDGGVGGQPVNQLETPLQQRFAYGGPTTPQPGQFIPPNMMQTFAQPRPPQPPQPPQPLQPTNQSPQQTQPTPLPQTVGNKPLSLNQFRPPQNGLQIQGNPTASLVQRPQQR